MRKSLYFLVFIIFVSSCKFDENPYSYNREYDDGTYITSEGIVKYISGLPDTAITISDNYAVIREEIKYIREDESSNFNIDSVLIYGHCYSEMPGAFANPEDSVITLERLRRYSVIQFNGSSQPESFISPDELGIGSVFTNTLPLHYETDYYIKSFVVTGSFDSNGDPIYEHIAYNPKELKITTKNPVDLWVGGTMLEAPVYFSDFYRAGTSFTYNGYLFVAQGHNEDSYGNSIIIYRYDPVLNIWNNPYKSFPIEEEDNFSDCISFVIEDVPIGNNIYKDCVFIGVGKKQGSTSVNKNIYRLDLEANTTGEIGDWGEWTNITEGLGAEVCPANAYNGVAFSIDGIGYVGLGTTSVGVAINELYKYDPADKGTDHIYGKWTQIGDFPGGPRTQAVCFQLGDNVYISCGKDNNGIFKKDLRMCRQTTGNDLSWENKSEFPGTARIEAVAFNIGEMGYLGTGWDGDSARSDFYRYNPFLNKWEQKAYFSGESRFEAIGQGIKITDDDYRGYIGTGWNGTTYFLDVWHYRP
jgi:N-acetylneuraminic acid mutarotase